MSRWFFIVYDKWYLIGVGDLWDIVRVSSEMLLSIFESINSLCSGTSDFHLSISNFCHLYQKSDIKVSKF